MAETLPPFQWGETEYGIGILPLGGYVKMLGQDDNPGKAAESASGRPSAVNRSIRELHGPKRAQADGNHFGRCDHERDLHVRIVGRGLRHRRSRNPLRGRERVAGRSSLAVGPAPPATA